MQKEAPFKNSFFDALPIGMPQGMLFLILALAMFFQQLTNWSMAFLDVQKIWGLSKLQATDAISNISFWYFLPMSLAAFVAGPLSDAIGRHKLVLSSLLVYSIASFTAGMNSSITSFIISRAICGFSLFALMVPAFAYIVEVSPKKSRAKCFGFVTALGFTAAPISAFISTLTLPVAPEAIRYLFYFSSLAILPFAIGIVFLLPSPRWLVAKGKHKAAENVMLELTNREIDLSGITTKPPLSLAKRLCFMFQKKYQKRTAMLIILYVFITPPMAVTMGWSIHFLSAHINDTAKLLRTITLMLCGVPVGQLILLLAGDKIQRKSLLIIMLLASAITSGVFSQLTTTAALSIASPIFSGCYIGLSFTSFLYMAELYPTAVRGTTNGIIHGIGRFCTSLFSLLIPFLSLKLGSTGIYALISLFFLIPLPFLILWGEETTGKSLEEIEK